MKKKIFYIDLISAVLLLLFLYTAITKISDHQRFQSTLRLTPFIYRHAVILSWLIPVAELIICVLLLLPQTRKKGIAASLVLLCIFTLYLLYMVLFTPDRPCNCGGVISQMTWPQHIAFNLFFIFLAFTGVLIDLKNKKSLRPTPP